MKKTFLTSVIVIAAVTMLTAQQAEKETIYFDHDSYALTADSKAKLEKVCKSAAEKKITKFKIAGHTDSDGSGSYNDTLSKSRAQSVREFLESCGMSRDKIEIKFFGETQPVASNENAEGKHENRRVEIMCEYEAFSMPQEFKAQAKSFLINPKKDTAIALTSKGTVIHVPKDCFIDMNGEIVKENVNLKFTEFNNSAEMAFSNIPMTYKTNGGEFFFNSSGMFEIKGSVNNNPVQVAKNKSMKIDFALAKQNPDINFFQLKADGNWKKVQDIATSNEDRVAKDTVVFLPVGDWDVDSVRFDNMLVFIKNERVGDADIAGLYNKNNRLLGSGMDVGHTYPDIIRGLNVDSFGVYNCDQIYNIPNLVAVEATYLDGEGNKIKDLQVLSLIDLKYNGAFSFSPINFQCNAKGENVLALFTKDKKLYILSKSEFAKMKIDKSGHYTFTMKDMTETIQSTKDLANYLGIKM